jgi:uncharacterized protein YigE (DUF2233 family)
MIRLAPRLPLLSIASLLLTAMAGCAPQARALDSEVRAFEGQNYRVVSIDLKREPLTLHWRDPDSGEPFGGIDGLRQWGEASGRRLLFAPE